MSRAETNRDTNALREEIIQTRADLGQTIQQLAERADVKSRVRASAAHTSKRVRGSVRRAGGSPVPWFVLAAGAAAAVVLLLLARGRRR
jgi:hypothetical protein